MVFEHQQYGIVARYTSGELTPEQKNCVLSCTKTIAKVTNDMGVRKQFNTAIAAIMELLNSYSKVAFTGEMVVR